jgi:hypothetical protein
MVINFRVDRRGIRCDLAVIGKFWVSEKRHGIFNIITSAVFLEYLEARE